MKSVSSKVDAMPGGRKILNALREGTREDHEQLELRPALRALVGPDLDLQAYGRVLRVFHGFYSLIEQELSHALPKLYASHPQSAYEYHSRHDFLARDLADIGQKPAQNNLPLAERQLIAPGPEAALGMLYVLEGASQGGRVISRCVANSLSLGPDYGAHYFHLHERIDGWSAYRNWLACGFDVGVTRLAVPAARAVFRELANRMDNGH